MVKLFIGCAPYGEDAESCAVAEYTARKHCSEPLEIEWMHQSQSGFWSGWNTASWRTPFSGFRWGIPAFCQYEGRAIYADSDFIFMGDLADLWHQPIPVALLARSAGRKGKTCCLLFDCARMDGLILSIDKLKALSDPNGWVKNNVAAEATSAFSGDWNCIDGGSYQTLHDPRIKALHYSRMAHQPHLAMANARLAREGRTHWYTGETVPHPNPDLTLLFMQELEAAIAAGYTLDRYYFEATDIVKKNFVYDTPRKR